MKHRKEPIQQHVAYLTAGYRPDCSAWEAWPAQLGLRSNELKSFLRMAGRIIDGQRGLLGIKSMAPSRVPMRALGLRSWKSSWKSESILGDVSEKCLGRLA